MPSEVSTSKKRKIKDMSFTSAAEEVPDANDEPLVSLNEATYSATE
jgi:hypothetical protein